MHTIDFTPNRRYRKPRTGMLLPSGFHQWPEIRALPLAAIGAFVDCSIWAHEFTTIAVPKEIIAQYRRKADVRPLYERGLWREVVGGDTVIRGVATLQAGRGRRAGLAMRLDRLLSSGPEMLRAGLAAFGVYALAASWSLTTDLPGYIPTETALTFGKQKHVAALWDAGLWSATELGFLMPQGAHPTSPRWDLFRTGERGVISDELRQAVFDRDGRQCVKCQSPENLTLDHVIAWSRGGPDTYENLRTLCRSCNSAKGARVE